ncbi:GNAT family N-acetyltransferase [Novosphingobium sp. PhB165]|uniref:GNAT family N-acetyltransferase n=1 Tax=Novosphingobium sp. PhB165 TaxID=2485105 RepID=UPI0014042957|nr:GNAT family N-acetyltransferase [Novosphingobium sp. PhB165]
MKALGDEMAPLVIEAESEGHRSMRRLRDEWSSGANRFQGAGEFLLAAYAGGKLIAVGGLNIDPYSSALGIGRIRHVYVCSQARRRGVGTMLVKHIIVGAGRRFSTLRLRTTTAEAAAFYERLGFHGCNEEAATHILELGAT